LSPQGCGVVDPRQHFFGAENVAANGSLPRGRVILSWFSVASFAAAIDCHVALRPEAVEGPARPPPR
jgi:hypothetical protein